MDKKIIALIVGVIAVISIATVAFLMTNNGNSNDNNGTVNPNLPNEDDNNNVDNDDNQENNDDNNEGDENVNTGKRALVLYFSMSGNTETVANFIHDEVGGDIVKLETVNTYPTSYNDLLDYAQNEQRTDARPELRTTINVDDYDIIFLGYPNWWGDMPMPIYSFLDNYDLSGKTIAPFITHGGSGLSGTPNTIRGLEPNATVTDGLAVSSGSVSSSQSNVSSWIERIGF